MRSVFSRAAGADAVGRSDLPLWAASCANRLARPVVWASIALMAAPGCGQERPPPPAPGFPPVNDAGFIDTAPPGPPPLDAAGLCGNALIPIVDERPNLYFLVDHSGSMTQVSGGSTLADATHDAIRDVLKLIGHHVRYGAAVFPNPDVGECSAGKEVFKTTLGDPPSPSGTPGQSLGRLMNSLRGAPVRGGTPISPTLEILSATLSKLEGKTYVVLATDGGPNCNAEQTCDVAGCQLNIEGVTVGGQSCDDDFNCCDPAFGLGAQLNCLDEDPTVSAVASLRAQGIDTFVIGMMGSEPYQNTLNQLAVAGGRPRSENPRYYSVASPEALSATLTEIGLAVAISCTINLDEAPPDPNLVNVYFDTELVESDPEDGWVWRSETQIELVGAKCTELQGGRVTQVQIVSGCPTEVK